MTQVLPASSVVPLNVAHGHTDTFLTDNRGAVFKLNVGCEKEAYERIQKDTLRQHTAEYFGEVTIKEEGRSYIQLADIRARVPILMDCKMGTRTFLEEECSSTKPRPDLYKKMVTLSPDLPTADENAAEAVTKLRYMLAREELSSTSVLGFRVDGIVGATVKHKLSTVREKSEICDVFLAFVAALQLKEPKTAIRALITRLKKLEASLLESSFFATHEMIGTSLLFSADKSSSDIDVFLIDFAKCVPLPEGVQTTHNAPWEKGNHEDGWLTGLTNLISVWETVAEM
eukprot:TRINITY_DN14058_c0_g1_i2.p1 TRINITY_DN14058_c0_g1~~TRINITY_DN14058_c0_g1_i2.p1  ORF type:complete len:286 (+),score=54.55 TRINITY_DN14058_c0_g1_i2:55-912(+)